MSSTMAFKFVDVKANKEYHLKPGKQLIASKNYSGPEDVDLTLTCDDSVAPFLVELSIKKQSARLTCLVGYCVAKSMGIGAGGTLKLRNGTSVEFGEINCLEMQFIIQQDEGQAHGIDGVGQTKRVRRKLPETPGIPAEPPPKPARKHSAGDQFPPPKPLRTKSKSASAIITAPYSEVTEIKRKISREVNMRKDLEEGSLKGSNAEVSTKVANSICYQVMLQPNGSDLITNKLFDAINGATKIMEQHMLLQMEEFLVTYRNSLEIQATPDCLLPADAPVIKHLLDAIIRSPSMEGTKEVCSVCVEVLVILCLSSQNRLTIINNEGIGTLTTVMRMNMLQFCFELQCNCWKLLTIMMDTMLDNVCDQAGNLTAAVMEVSCDLARQQLLNFNNNCPLACAITSYLVSAVTFCSNSNDSNLMSLFTKLRNGDIMQLVMGVATNVKQNEQFKQQCSKLASLLAPDYDSQAADVIVSELEASTGVIPIAAHDSFKKDLESYVSNSLKASVSTSVVEANSIPRKTSSPSVPEQLTDNSTHRSLSKSKSDSLVLSNTGLEDAEPTNSSRVRRESKVKEYFFKSMCVADQQEAAKVITDQQEQTTDIVCQKEQTKSSTNMAEQQETRTDTVNQKEQEGFTDISDQEKQTKSSADTIDKQEELPMDLVDQQEEERLPTDGTTDQVKPSAARRQMDMSSQYMKHTLKRQYKNTSTETGNSRRQSWGSDVTDLSHMPGTIKEFSKEQASIEEMMDAHEDVVAVLTTRTEAINTLVPLWRQGKSLQAAINAEASCLNDGDTDMILFSDLLSMFKRYKSGWTLAVSLVFLRYFKQLLQDLSDPKYLQVIHDALKMIVERFTDIILSCKQSSTNNIKLSGQVDRHQKEMCYEELQEIQEIITKELATITLMKTSDDNTQEAVEHYRKLQNILEPFRQPLN